MSNPFSRESFLAAAKHLKTEVVDVPEIGGSITVRELTAGKALALGGKVRADDKDAMLLWLIASVVDENGLPMFTEADLPQLQDLSAAVVLKIGARAVKLTGLNSDPGDASKNSVASAA